MAGQETRMPLAPEIRSLLRGLRWRIRAYVWVEGLVTALVWLSLTFWIALALDYFPVLVWANELPRETRAVTLVAIAGVLAWILYRWILARAFVRLGDRSMAILLERRYPKFSDSLVTTVELSRLTEDENEFSPEMLDYTRRQALSEVDSVRLRQVFRASPLASKLVAALVLIVPVIVFAAVRTDAFELSVRRLYLLDETPWPRNAQIEIVGIEVERISPRTGEMIFTETRPFQNREVKVARGATLALRVRASTNVKTVPDYCRIVYRTADGSRGQVNMRRDGSARDGYQYFTYMGKPFQGMLEDLEFDVIGYDHRVNQYNIRVVEAPAVVETELVCKFPEYLVDRENNLWLPRTMTYRSSGTQLPKGTQIVIRMTANKPLYDVEFSMPGDNNFEHRQMQGADQRTVEYVVDSLNGSFTLDVMLRDVDGVYSKAPHRLFLSAVEDQIPTLDIAMRGIGSAVTPDVMIPAKGTINDDHAVAESWFAFHINETAEQQRSISRTRDGSVDATLDFRDMRAEVPPVELVPGDRLMVTVKASDRFNLDGGPQVGTGERLELEVVTAEELLLRLDRRELAERRRFEHILDELTQMRDSLVRVEGEILGLQPGLDPADRLQDESSSAPSSADEPAPSKIDLRALRVQQAQRQTQKSAAEVLGVSAAFHAIRDELTYNRIDAEDRKSRLKERIADPLQHIADTMFPEMERRLATLEAALSSQQEEEAAANAAIAQSNELLLALHEVLESMLDIESYNELIEIVRALIQDQQRLQDETQKARARDALDLLK